MLNFRAQKGVRLLPPNKVGRYTQVVVQHPERLQVILLGQPFDGQVQIRSEIRLPPFRHGSEQPEAAHLGQAGQNPDRGRHLVPEERLDTIQIALGLDHNGTLTPRGLASKAETLPGEVEDHFTSQGKQP